MIESPLHHAPLPTFSMNSPSSEVQQDSRTVNIAEAHWISPNENQNQNLETSGNDVNQIVHDFEEEGYMALAANYSSFNDFETNSDPIDSLLAEWMPDDEISNQS